MELERELQALTIAWPATPSFQGVPAKRRRRWPLVAAIALAAAFAVPQSRGAILRFFDLGADRIELVGTLPRAQERPLGAQLGEPQSLADARATVPELLLPPVRPLPPLHRSTVVVSLLFAYHGRTVLLSEVAGNGVFLKKLVSSAATVDPVTVRDGRYGLWLSGSPHVFFFPREPARLAGNTLVWQGNGTTYRLEARGLTRREALDLARTLRDTP